MYLYICMSISISISIYLSIYIYIYMCVCVCVYIRRRVRDVASLFVHDVFLSRAKKSYVHVAKTLSVVCVK